MPKRFAILKNEYELHKSLFFSDMLSEVEQNKRVEYVQNAPGFDARYLGVVVWKLRNLSSTIEKSKKCLKNVENVLFLALF